MHTGIENNNPGSEIPSIPDGKDSSSPVDVEFWHDVLLNYYGSDEHMRRTTVIRLDWYKYVGGVEHEYVLATVVRHTQGQKSFYLRLERRVSEEPFTDENRTNVKEETVDSDSQVLHSNT